MMKRILFYVLSISVLAACAVKPIRPTQQCPPVESTREAAQTQAWWSATSAAIEAIRSGDKERFERLLHRPLRVGPTMGELAEVELPELFDARTLHALKAAQALCGAFNSQGGFIADGAIWFAQMANGQVKIISIPGAKRLRPRVADLEPPILGAQGVIAPACLEGEWMSSDNFKDYAQRYGLTLAQLRDQPLQRVNTGYARAFCWSWAKDTDPCTGASRSPGLLRSLDACLRDVSRLQVEGARVTSHNINQGTESYEVLSHEKAALCQRLVPADWIVDRCFAARKDEGRSASFGLWATFARGYLGPVKTFFSESSARDWLQRQRRP